MQAATLKSFKTLLSERKQNLLEQVRKVEKDLENQASGAADWAEHAQAREGEEVLTSIDGEKRHQLDAIEDALNRIDLGTFGTCTVCLNKIQDARLEALPWASMCIECKEEQEAGGDSEIRRMSNETRRI